MCARDVCLTLSSLSMGFYPAQFVISIINVDCGNLSPQPPIALSRRCVTQVLIAMFYCFSARIGIIFSLACGFSVVNECIPDVDFCLVPLLYGEPLSKPTDSVLSFPTTVSKRILLDDLNIMCSADLVSAASNTSFHRY